MVQQQSLKPKINFWGVCLGFRDAKAFDTLSNVLIIFILEHFLHIIEQQLYKAWRPINPKKILAIFFLNAVNQKIRRWLLCNKFGVIFVIPLCLSFFLTYVQLDSYWLLLYQFWSLIESGFVEVFELFFLRCCCTKQNCSAHIKTYWCQLR